MIELTQEVITSKGAGVIYWEPAWVSSPCYTQWGQGSHQEHATFFDFQNDLLLPGGIQWMKHDYQDLNTSVSNLPDRHVVQILINSFSGNIKIKQHSDVTTLLQYSIQDSLGRNLIQASFDTAEKSFYIDNLPHGTYIISVQKNGKIVGSKIFIYGSG